jgi:plastocyanin
MSATHNREQPDTRQTLRWRGARGAVTRIRLAGLAVVCLTILLPLTASTRPAVREITLVTRDMAFYFEGGTVPNPTIRLDAGEEVRFILRNLDPGIAHNLAIEGWELATAYLDANASATLHVRVPEQPGRQVYVCVPHREMMRGVIEVVAGD